MHIDSFILIQFCVIIISILIFIDDFSLSIYDIKLNWLSPSLSGVSYLIYKNYNLHFQY